MPYAYVSTTTQFLAGQVSGNVSGKILLIAKAAQASSGYGIVKEIKNLTEAYAEYGSSDANDSQLINMIEIVLKQIRRPEKVYCIAVGKWTDSGTTHAPAAAIAKGASTLTIATDVTGTYAVGAIIKIAETGKATYYFTVKTRSFGGGNTTITFGDYEKAPIAYTTSAVITLINAGAADHAANAAYETAYAAMLNQPLEQGGDVDMVVLDSWLTADIIDLKTNIDTASDNNRERLAVFGAHPGQDSSASYAAFAQVTGIPSYRMICIGSNFLDGNSEVVSPGVTAAAVATVILGEPNPANPVHELEFRGFIGMFKEWQKADFDALHAGGVTALWSSPTGILTIENGKTTNISASYPKEIEISRIADYMEKFFRVGIGRVFAREKNTGEVRDRISSYIRANLDNQIAQQIIDDGEGREPTFSVESDYDPDTGLGDKTKVNITINFYPVNAIKSIVITNNLNLG